MTHLACSMVSKCVSYHAWSEHGACCDHAKRMTGSLHYGAPVKLCSMSKECRCA